MQRTHTHSVRTGGDVVPTDRDDEQHRLATRQEEAGAGNLHAHDLRYTAGMHLRDAGVPEGTIADLLWHSKQSITQNYSVA